MVALNIMDATLDDRPVLIKSHTSFTYDKADRDIAMSTQMSGHENLLKLLGCFLEFHVPLLVYKYVEYGPFDDHRGLRSLLWKIRLKVAIGIANAITYLHTSFPRPIIHRELTLSITFLDKDFVPKLCNFALSLSIPEGKTHATGTSVHGTASG
ncbi:hypothetical protein TIFTF001_022319 [Ficus carica]|uniref:Protein kinase domain-containing protein n=1 Tax=Ficus carica TaxID=3494 RepID=A0AA88AEB8_FICCA|nr:hypothetical protein TIFTF001_022319 [Ficus carica]